LEAERAYRMALKQSRQANHVRGRSSPMHSRKQKHMASSSRALHFLPWIDLLSPLQHRQEQFNAKTPMFTVRASRTYVGGITVIPHLELNIHPLNVHLTYGTYRVCVSVCEVC